MTIDLNKLPLVVLPAKHLLFKNNQEVMEIANTNQNLKKLLITLSLTVVGILIINLIKNKKNERGEKN
jgi:hypothetical protein